MDRPLKMTAVCAATCAAVAKIAGAAPATVVPGLFPPDVRTVGIVSVSSLLPREQLVAGTNALVTAGYRVKVAPNVEGPDVASAEERARLLEAAWLDPEIDILWFARGGEGAAEVIPLLNWDALRARPDRRVVGFSDLTLLLNAMLREGIGHPYSGPMLSALRYWNANSRDWFAKALSGAPLPALHARPLKESGAAVGGLPMGGHLERVHRLAGMGLLPRAAGRIVFLECTAKYPPAKIRQCLEDLRDGGFLADAAAVVFCDFRHTGDAHAEIDAFLPVFAATLPCPVFAGFPYGHCPESRLLDFQREVRIDGQGVVEFSAP